jgi:peptidoglycan/xylan/chitin deacetylase (PgdA/CDA1 family)
MFILTVTRRQIVQKLAVLLGVVALLGGAAMLGGRTLVTTADGDLDKPLTRADSPDNRLALTFDVTWGQDELNKILTTLDSQQVKGTFFVGGTFMTIQGDAVKQLSAKGHEIGTLGQKIVDLSTLPEQEVTSNLLASQSLIAKLLGGPVRYFRPPQGPATPSVVRAARAANLIAVTHSLDSGDHLGITADQIASRVVKGAQKGDIVLLSASDFSRDTNPALPRMIKGLKERGFKLVRLSELVPAELHP